MNKNIKLKFNSVKALLSYCLHKKLKTQTECLGSKFISYDQPRLVGAPMAMPTSLGIEILQNTTSYTKYCATRAY